MEGRSHLISLIALCDEMIGSVDEGMFIFNFCKTPDAVSLNILINKPMKHRPGKDGGLDQKWAELGFVNRGNEQQLQASHRWCTPGVDTEAGTV